MNVEDEIWNGFCTSLTTLAARTPILFAGVEVDPPRCSLWWEARIFIGPTDNYGLAEEGPFDYSGFLQVSVCQRPGAGLGSLFKAAKTIVDRYKKGTLIGPGLVETIPSILSVIEAPERVSVPVRIPYHASIIL